MLVKEVFVDAKETEERFNQINEEFPNNWDIQRKVLEVGDYVCGISCVEWKTSDVSSFEHMYEQCRSMVNSYPKCHLIIQKTMPQAIGAILQNRKVSKYMPYGLFASISKLGVQIWFVSNITHGFRLLKSIFEKDNSDKDSSAIPIRVQRYKANPVIQSYMAYPGVGETRAIQLYEKFPVPAKLHKLIANLDKREFQWFKDHELTKFKAVLIKIHKIEYGHWEEEEEDE